MKFILTEGGKTMEIKYIDNDILCEPANIICHQVNCMGVMGAGLAKQIRNKFPFVYSEYKALCDEYTNKRYKQILLGKAQIIDVENRKSMHSPLNDYVYDNSISVCNLFGQYEFGRGVHTKPEALERAIYNLCFLISQPNNEVLSTTISIPYGIGCGLAGGDWNEIEPMIIRAFQKCEDKYNLDITLKIVKFGGTI